MKWNVCLPFGVCVAWSTSPRMSIAWKSSIKIKNFVKSSAARAIFTLSPNGSIVSDTESVHSILVFLLFCHSFEFVFYFFLLCFAIALTMVHTFFSGSFHTIRNYFVHLCLLFVAMIMVQYALQRFWFAVLFFVPNRTPTTGIVSLELYIPISFHFISFFRAFRLYVLCSFLSVFTVCT